MIDMDRYVRLIKYSSLLAVFLTVIFVGTAFYEISRNPLDLSLYDVALVTNQPSAGTDSHNRLPTGQGRETGVNLLFFGDLMLDRHVKERIEQYGFDQLLAGLATSTGLELDRYRLVSANLEGAATDGGAHYPPVNSYDFAFVPDYLSRLHEYGFNFFNLANNHALDQGNKGMDETRKNLDSIGYDYSGCSDGIVSDCSTKVVAIAGKNIGLAGYSMVYSKLDNDKLLAAVEQLAEKSDFTVVQIHWGVEYEHMANPLQVQIAHSLIDAGADVVIGHHPHVVEGLEIYRGKPIFYSLGNFIFDQYFSPDTQEELAVTIERTGTGTRYELLPLKSHLSVPELMNAEEKEVFINKYIEWSELANDYKDQLLRTSSFVLPIL